MLNYKINDKDEKVDYLYEYNIENIKYNYLHNLLENDLKLNFKNLTSQKLSKYKKTFNCLFSMLIKKSLFNNYVKKETFGKRLEEQLVEKKEDDYYSLAVFVPKNRNIYFKKSRCEEYKEVLENFNNFIDKYNLKPDIIEYIISFLEKMSFIKIIQGGSKKYKKIKSFRDVKKRSDAYISIEDGLFRRIFFNNPLKWGIGIENFSFTKTLNDLFKFTESKYNYDKSKSGKVIYRDKSKTSKGKNIKFDNRTLKYSKNKNVLEFCLDNDPLQIELDRINSYYEKKTGCDILFKCIRVYGKDNKSYGRFWSPYNRLQKELRKRVNDELGLTEEIDIKNCNPQIAFIAATGDKFKDNRYEDDLYLTYLAHMPSIRKLCLKKDNKTIDLDKLRMFRNFGKKINMLVIGNNSYTGGRLSIRENLLNMGCYQNYWYISNFDKEKHDIRLSKDEQNRLWEEYREKENISIKQRPKLKEDEVITAIEYTLCNHYDKKNKIMGNFIFTDIYPFTQYVESEILVSLIRKAMKNNQLLFHCHDAIYVNSKIKKKFKFLQDKYLNKISKKHANKLYELKKDQILKGKNNKYYKDASNRLNNFINLTSNYDKTNFIADFLEKNEKKDIPPIRRAKTYLNFSLFERNIYFFEFFKIKDNHKYNITSMYKYRYFNYILKLRNINNSLNIKIFINKIYNILFNQYDTFFDYNRVLKLE